MKVKFWAQEIIKFREYFWVSLAILWTSSPVFGESLEPPINWQQQQDFIFPPKESLQTNLLGKSISAIPAPATPIDKAEVVNYVSFKGNTYSLTEFRGKNVSILLPDSWVTGLSLEERRTLLDRTDLLYEHFKNLVGEEPLGSDLLRIAFVMDSCGWGCGYIGSKGVEVLDADWSLAIAKAALQSGHVPEVISHEMSHNFDVYFNYLSYLREHAHAWTAFLDDYIQVFSQQGYLEKSPTTVLNKNVMQRWDQYLNSPGATWQNFVRDGDPNLERTHLAWGGLNLRFAQLNGPAAMRAAMQFLHNYKVQTPFTQLTTPEEKEDLRMQSLASGAELNISCFADEWRWQASVVLRETLSNSYGNQNPFCVDIDLDGYSALQGDLDDHNPSVHPGAVEIRNEVDDDCDEIVDNVIFSEPVGGDFTGHPNATVLPSLPVRIKGFAGTYDSDYFLFTLPQPEIVNFSVRPSPEFQGLLHMHAENRLSWLTSLDIPLGTDAAKSWNYASAGDWTFEIYEPVIASPAEYSIDVYTLDPWPIDWGVVQPAEKVGGAYRLTLNTTNLPGLTPRATEVRFWVSGVGFVKSVAYRQSVSYDWVPSADVEAGTYAYRAQLFSGDIPITNDTPAQYFTVQNVVNQSPVANAGSDQTVKLGDTVILDGSASSDPDNYPSPLTYVWTQLQGPIITLKRSDKAKPIFKPIVAGTYTFSLVVSDGKDTSVPDTVTVTIPFADQPIHVLQPNGGELWKVGKTQSIKWLISPKFVMHRAPVSIWISKDLGAHWIPIGVDLQNMSTFSWKPGRQFATPSALVKVCALSYKKLHKEICDVSDGTFTIAKKFNRIRFD